MGNLDCPLWIWVVICHKKQLVRNEWLLVVISNTTVLRIQASKSPKGIAVSAFVATTIPADTFHPHLPCWEGVCWDKQRLKTWYGNIFIIQTLQNTKFPFFFPLRAFQKHQTKFRKQNCGAGNENPVFELRRRFFFQRCFTFFWGWLFLRFWQGFIAAFTFLLWCASQKLWDFFITDLKKHDMLQLLDLGFEPMH